MADVPGKFYRATKVRTGVAPSSAGSIEGEVLPPVNPPGSSLNSVGLTMPSAFTVSNSPLTSNGTIGVAGAGTVAQYIRGDGSLADFPESSGGGSSVSYYLNGSVDQGTIGGVAYKELSKVPILGAGTDFTINADGYIASFITDAGDPSLLEIPGGNWNFETYFSASSSGGTPTFYVELYKVSGTTATLIASSSSAPELIAFGTNLTPYFSSLAVPTTTLALTDRLAVRYYVTHSGRTITLHTENNHLCQIITTFTTGLTALNGLTAQVQNFAVGSTGTDFNIASATATHTFNLPTASATNRGALSSADWSLFTQAYNDKINSAAVTGTTTKTLTLTQQDGGTITASWSDLNTDAVLSVFGRTGAVVAANGDYTTAQVTESGNLYYTDSRSRAALSFAAGSGAYNTSTGVITINGLSLSTQVLSLGLASAGVTGALSGTDWSTFNSKQNALTLTTTGTSGAATLVGATLNIPNYGSALSGYLPLTGGTLTNTGSNQNPILRFVSSSTDIFQWITQAFNASVGSGNTMVHFIGQSASSGNSGYIGYNWVSDNSVNNFLSFGFFNYDHLLRLYRDGNFTIGGSSNAGFKLDVNGTGRFTSDLTSNRYRGVNSLVLNSYTTINPSSNVYLYSPPNDRDAWIYLDSADTGSNWGIYHRQIDSAVSGLPANSIGFVGGGSSTLQAWISLANGNGFFAGSLTATNLSGTNTGNVTIGTANGLSLSGQTLSLGLSSGSANGALSSTDWTTFNNKQNALTNPVTGTGTTNYLPKFTGSTTIGDSQIVDDGTTIQIGSIPLGGKLNITNGNANLNIYFATLTSSAWNSSLFLRGGSSTSTSSLNLGYSGSDNDAYIRRNSDGRLSLGTSQNDKLSIFFGGNVFVGSSVGMSDNGAKLQVSGNARFTRANDSGSILRLESVGNNGFDFSRNQSNGALEIQGSQTGFNNIVLAPTSGNVLIASNSDNGAAIVQIGGSNNTKLSLKDGSSQNGMRWESVSGANAFYLFNGSFDQTGWGLYNITTAALPLWISNDGNLILNRGASSAGVNTATPKNIRFNNDYSGGYTDASLKIYLYNSGSTIQGFTSGPEFDLQYHSSGSTLGKHVFYVANNRIMTVNNANVLIGTGTDNGTKLQVSSAVTGSTPAIDCLVTGSGRFLRGFRILNSGMSGGTDLMLSLGQSESNRNMGQFYYYYAGSNSTANRASIGLFGVDDVLNVMGSSNVLIGTTTDTGAKLEVNGTIRTGTLDGGRVSGFWKLGRAVIGTQPTNTHQIIVEINGLLYVIPAALL